MDSSLVLVDGRRGERMEGRKIPTGHKYVTGGLNQIKNLTYRTVAAQCGM